VHQPASENGTNIMEQRMQHWLSNRLRGQSGFTSVRFWSFYSFNLLGHILPLATAFLFVKPSVLKQV